MEVDRTKVNKTVVFHDDERSWVATTEWANGLGYDVEIHRPDGQEYRFAMMHEDWQALCVAMNWEGKEKAPAASGNIDYWTIAKTPIQRSFEQENLEYFDDRQINILVARYMGTLVPDYVPDYCGDGSEATKQVLDELYRIKGKRDFGYSLRTCFSRRELLRSTHTQGEDISMRRLICENYLYTMDEISDFEPIDWRQFVEDYEIMSKGDL